MTDLMPPFRPLDRVLADRICQWHQSDDALLWHTAVLTSFALQQGHTCLWPEQAMLESPYRDYALFGGMELPPADDWLQHLSQFELSAHGTSPLVVENDRVYLRRYWQFEQELAEFLQRTAPSAVTLSAERKRELHQKLDQFFPPGEADINWQRVAALNCLLDPTHIIIGGPGTGKTYTVTRILALFCAVSETRPLIRLAAPTGKAAGRLAEAINHAKQSLNLDLVDSSAIPDTAQTLHRLLGVIPNQLQFRHHRDNPIDADILLIDEVSMVDLPMMARLTRAIAPHTRVILLGDADQLPSVAAGSVLADLVDKPHPGFSSQRLSELKKLDPKLSLQSHDPSRDFVTELRHSRRFSESSGIGQLAKAVIAGQASHARTLFSQYEDIQWQPVTDLRQTIRQWAQQHYACVAQQDTLTAAFAQLKTFRVLCATREGERGTEQINEQITTQLNPQRRAFYQGQPIMVNQNHYGLKLFNGDIGLIWPDAKGQLLAWFEQDSGHRPVALGRLPGFETVYAMTIHKTQGSEFDHVAMLLPDIEHSLITRELLYTGITRAKKQCDVISPVATWDHGVSSAVTRWAGLRLKV